MIGRAFAVALLLTMAPVTAGCVTTGTNVAAVDASTSKALIIAADAYHVATTAAIAAAPLMSAETKVAVGKASDAAAMALQDAYNLRTAASLQSANDAIARLAALVKGLK